jgi:tRNA (guanine-N7-)-methyltransferase
LQNTAEDYAERPAYRPNTKFEKRGIKLGHGVWDLVFSKK